jgi:RimJ/RimL family protein N-acetyltransferase
MEADAELVLDWRNDPVTRAMSLDQEPVPLPQHLLWFRSALADPRRLLLIAERDGESIGMCRFDLEEESARAEVSINLAPAHRGSRLGGAVLRGALRTLEQMRPGIRDVIAVVRPENIASVRLFESVGFTRTGCADEETLRYGLRITP